MTRHTHTNLISTHEVEHLIVTVAELPREELMTLLTTDRCPFPLDFTTAYLDSLNLDRLRHLVIAVYLQASKSARQQPAA